MKVKITKHKKISSKKSEWNKNPELSLLKVYDLKAGRRTQKSPKTSSTEQVLTTTAETWKRKVTDYIKRNDIDFPKTIVLDNGICTISPTNKKSF